LDFGIRILDLFRISDFGFRIYFLRALRLAWGRVNYYTKPMRELILLGWKCLLVGMFLAAAGCKTSMPGESFSGALPIMKLQEVDLSESLHADVEMLAGTIGERNVFHPEKLEAAAEFIEQRARLLGYEPQSQVYEVRNVAVRNIDFEIKGSVHPEQIVVVGAHYDAVRGSPAANDNGSGTAALLELARLMKESHPRRTLRFVFFVNEEPPFFWTRNMGSLVYAKRCRERREEIVGMLSLETIGYYSEEKGSQGYPFPFRWFYPGRGNFIAFIGNYESRGLVERCVKTFRQSTTFPCEGGAVIPFDPHVGASDQWSFWKEGYAGLMVTDTAPYRYPHYHKVTDTPDKLDYDSMARVVMGLTEVIGELCGDHLTRRR
jgi:hypothetical protein